MSKHFNKATAFTSALLLAAALLSGCTDNNEDISSQLPTGDVTTASTAETVTETAAPETTTEEPTTEPVSYRQEKIFTKLSCMDDEQYDIIPDFVSLGGGLEAVYAYDNNNEGRTLMIVDVMEDKILKTKELPLSYSLIRHTDKGLVFFNANQCRFEFYDNELNLTDTFEHKFCEGKFSSDGESFYCIVSNEIYRFNVSDGSYKKFDSPKDIKFMDYYFDVSPDERYIAANASYRDSETGVFNYADVVFDTSDSSVKLAGDTINYTTFCNDRMITQTNHFDVLENYYYYVATSGDAYRTPTNTDTLCQKFLADDSGFIYSYNMDTQLLGIEKFSDDGQLSFTEIQIDDPEIYDATLKYMPEEELLLCYLTGENKRSLCLIDPLLLDLDKKTQCEKVAPELIYDEKLLDKLDKLSDEVPKVGEHLTKARSHADKIEEKYDIEIYLSDQCGTLFESGDKTYTSTADDFETFEEADQIEVALSQLEIALEKYPEGYFSQFRNIVGKGGVKVGFVSEILDDFSAAYAFKDSDNYYITMEILGNIEVNFSHEAWHSTESFITSVNNTLLMTDDWNKLNPEDFDYLGYNDYDTAPENIAFDCIYDPEYDPETSGYWYFYDKYGTANYLEDKARIMEVALNPMYYPTDEFFTSPHTKEKLKVMSEAIRKVFDTTGWDEIPWEAYIK